MFQLKGVAYKTDASTPFKPVDWAGAAEGTAAFFMAKKLRQLESERDSLSGQDPSPERDQKLRDVERRIGRIDPEYLDREKKGSQDRRAEDMAKREQEITRLKGLEARTPEDQRRLDRLDREHTALTELLAPGTTAKVEGQRLANERMRGIVQDEAAERDAESDALNAAEATKKFETELANRLQNMPPDADPIARRKLIHDLAAEMDIGLDADRFEQALRVNAMQQSADKEMADLAKEKAWGDALTMIRSSDSIEQIVSDPTIMGELLGAGQGQVVQQNLAVYRDLLRMRRTAIAEDMSPHELRQSAENAATFAMEAVDNFRNMLDGKLTSGGVDVAAMSDEDRFAWVESLFGNMNDAPEILRPMIGEISSDLAAADGGGNGQPGNRALTLAEFAKFRHFLDTRFAVYSQSRRRWTKHDLLMERRSAEDDWLNLGGDSGDGDAEQEKAATEALDYLKSITGKAD